MFLKMSRSSSSFDSPCDSSTDRRVSHSYIDPREELNKLAAESSW